MAENRESGGRLLRQRKEAGHYSGLNENWRSKTFLVFPAAYSLHTVRCVCTVNNDVRITQPAGLACRQMWLQQPTGICLSQTHLVCTVNNENNRAKSDLI